MVSILNFQFASLVNTSEHSSNSFSFPDNLLYLWPHGRGCCVWALPSCGEQGLLQLRSSGLSLWSTGPRAHGCSFRALEHRLAASVLRLRCSKARRVFPDQGLNPCPLRWQVESLPLSQQGSPALCSQIDTGVCLLLPCNTSPCTRG